MEIAGLNEDINPVRVQGIIKSVPKFYPAFTPDDFKGIQPWRGLRPCSPDGLPYIGRTRSHSNLVVATGHAMTGSSARSHHRSARRPARRRRKAVHRSLPPEPRPLRLILTRMNERSFQPTRSAALLAIQLLFSMVWGFGGIGKVLSGKPDWFADKFGKTLLATFPGLTASFWLLAGSRTPRPCPSSSPAWPVSNSSAATHPASSMGAPAWSLFVSAFPGSVDACAAADRHNHH